MIKKITLAWNQLCGFNNNSSDLTHLNSGFMGRLGRRISGKLKTLR